MQENTKPIIDAGTPEQKRSAQDTLYTALEGALCLIHPFMPFVTEELWQRLPRRAGDATRTICKARYPQFTPEFDSPESESAYDLVFQVIKNTRSLAAEYGLKSDMEVHLLGNDATTVATLKDQQGSIQALVKGISKLTVLEKPEDVPHGCAASVLGENCVVYLLVKGRVDVDAEISKTQKKLHKVVESRKRTEKSMQSKDYKAKVKPEVQEMDQKKVQDLLAEEKTLEELVKKFEGLRA